MIPNGTLNAVSPALNSLIVGVIADADAASASARTIASATATPAFLAILRAIWRLVLNAQPWVSNQDPFLHLVCGESSPGGRRGQPGEPRYCAGGVQEDGGAIVDGLRWARLVST